ncbi:carboxypeptidase regulatory-like domain-containing protein [Myxococcus sp. CA033]|uniref:carboxypeptidase-like regulatory domain-containing protein n=1 Tax=Myxococcus sp. CA033 TaxID=2741516 RepID=UPI00157B627A|nr:carboxypeptidase-like regulatory domain-containing protein [Myxococcus sp. CA033]NTX40547.1 carboxypeptidase regulatory-like domain-containing protein [Myxococcus sp. CA033]
MRLRLFHHALWVLSVLLLTSAVAEEPSARGSHFIEGLVVSSSGPVPDVEVRATFREHVLSTRTDARGHFVFRGVAGAPWVLTATRGSELGTQRVTMVMGNERFVGIELAPPRVVKGRVRGAAGTPLKGVRVRAGIQQRLGLLKYQEVLTGEDGGFEVPVPGFSPIAVLVNAPEHVSRYIAPVSVVAPLDVVLERSETLRGEVVDSDGKPVVGAWIHLKHYGRVGFPSTCFWPPPLSAQTRADGSFELPELARGRYSFLVEPKDRLSALGEVVIPSQKVRWVVPAGGRLTVAVVLPKGLIHPIWVHVDGPLGHRDVRTSSRARRPDEAGSASFDGMVPGRYLVSLSFDVLEEYRRVSREFRFEGEARTLTLDLQGARRFRGRLVDERGVAIQGGHAELNLELTGGTKLLIRRATARNGGFAFEHVPPGEASVFADAQGHDESQRVKVLDEQPEPVRLVSKREASVRDAVRVSGRVVDARGRPIPSFQVAHQSFENAQGRFSLSFPVEGNKPLYVSISAEGFAPELRKLAPRAGATVRIGDIKLGMGRLLTGRVEAPNGQGLWEATVRCRWPELPGRDGPDVCFGATYPDGSLYLSGVPDEPFLLEIQHHEWPRTRRLIPAGVDTAHLRLSPGLTLEGVVRDARGLPLESGGVLARIDGEDHFGTLSTDGTYVLRVPPGAGAIEVLNRPSEPVPFEGAEGQTVRANLVVLTGN